MKVLKIRGVSRKYLRLARVYRQFAQSGSDFFDFSKDALIECYKHETYGIQAAPLNGYCYGKWLKDLTVSMWVSDIRDGNFCKGEFITPSNSWWAKDALSRVMPATMFPWRMMTHLSVRRHVSATADGAAM